VSGW
jgi:hypothetical protein